MRFALLAAMLIVLFGCSQTHDKEPTGEPGNRVIGELVLTDLCVKDSIRRRGEGSEITVNCDLQPAEISLTAVDPGEIVVFAEIDCQCDANNQNCESCRCTASSDTEIERSCLSFITWCVDNDYDVKGNINDATCDF